jgi:holo-[acyl-carrier protein] synthase
MLTVGVDVVEIPRIEQALNRFGERFLRRIYTDDEVRFCRGRVAELAARFAAKEAVMKALGTGVRGVGWREIEVLPMRGGKPLVYLHDRAHRRAVALGIREMAVSLTHSAGVAIAVVAAEMAPPGGRGQA